MPSPVSIPSGACLTVSHMTDHDHDHDDDEPRIAPDAALFRRARERANARCPGAFTQGALARRFHHEHARSPESLRVRLAQWEGGTAATINTDLYGVLVDAIREALCDRDHGVSLDDVDLAYALEDDEHAARERVRLQRLARQIARREREVADAEAHVEWLREGLELLRGSQRAASERLAEWTAGAGA